MGIIIANHLGIVRIESFELETDLTIACGMIQKEIRDQWACIYVLRTTWKALEDEVQSIKLINREYDRLADLLTKEAQ